MGTVIGKKTNGDVNLTSSQSNTKYYGYFDYQICII